METKSIYITGRQALQLQRMARTRETIVAFPAPTHKPEPLDKAIRTIEDLHAEPMLEALGITPEHPLHLLVPNSSSRRTIGSIKMKVLSSELPSGGFLQLASAQSSDDYALMFAGLHVFVESPPLVVIDAAQKLEKLVRHGRLPKYEAIIKLASLASELCGSYARNPFDPQQGDLHYDEPNECGRFADPPKLASFLAQTSGMDGVRLARQSAQYVIDESGSPMETYINYGLTLPPRYAGLAFPPPLANKQLKVRGSVRTRLNHLSLRPDLQWPDFNTLLEYLGEKDHSSKSARLEDTNRMVDYAQTDYSAFPLMFDNVRNATEFNKTAQILARSLMNAGWKSGLYHVRSKLRDSEFLARQRKLVGLLLPPVSQRY
ncbi:MAG: hypothetical protein Q4B54_02660 [Coriobacteriales bacterium]|nr:hypothetical protein [Coriobacteriales bacterium]